MLRTPAPAYLQPTMRAAGFLVLGSLPGVVRDVFGLGWSRQHQLAYDALALASRTGRPLVPRQLRRGSSTEAYELVRRTERANLREGKASFTPIRG
jgi:uncharacterized protein (DUF2236 family)